MHQTTYNSESNNIYARSPCGIYRFLQTAQSSVLCFSSTTTPSLSHLPSSLHATVSSSNNISYAFISSKCRSITMESLCNVLYGLRSHLSKSVSGYLSNEVKPAFAIDRCWSRENCSNRVGGGSQHCEHFRATSTIFEGSNILPLTSSMAFSDVHGLLQMLLPQKRNSLYDIMSTVCTNSMYYLNSSIRSTAKCLATIFIKLQQFQIC
eukprot:Gb_27815 [translate_table: standard]